MQIDPESGDLRVWLQDIGAFHQIHLAGDQNGMNGNGLIGVVAYEYREFVIRHRPVSRGLPKCDGNKNIAFHDEGALDNGVLVA